MLNTLIWGLKRNRIIVIVDENELTWESLDFLKQQAEIYQATGIQDAFSHLSVCSYHLILIALQQEPEIICQFVETIRKLVITPMIVLLSEHAEIRNKIIHLGADAVLIQPCAAEENRFAGVCVDSPLHRMEVGKKRRKSDTGGETGDFSISKKCEMGSSNCPGCKKRV